MDNYMVIICLNHFTRIQDMNPAINARHKESCEQRKWLPAGMSEGLIAKMPKQRLGYSAMGVI